MMKFILYLMFMMFLLNNSIWLIGMSMFMLTFMFMIQFSFNFTFSYLSSYMGVDLLSYIMIFLSLFIGSLMLIASSKIYFNNNYLNLFMMNLILMIMVLLLTFSMMNIFLFYLFFEISIIPILFMITGWGYQPERLQAGVYMLFYTLTASLPMMISLFYYYYFYLSLSFFMMSNLNNNLMFLCMNLVFFVKIPMYVVHLWLPKAHVEAPIAGSMILAGIMLKLGGYGMLRVSKMFILNILGIGKFFLLFSLLGGAIISIFCMSQIDMKSLVAYSSISHMSYVMSGILCLNYWGFVGSLMMMVAHGICSSALFCLVNIYYERSMSRNIYINKGLLNLMPSLAMFMFLFCAFNMAAPPSLNLIGEILLISCLISWNYWLMILFIIMLFFGAVYSLYLYSFSQHGSIFSGFYGFMNCSINEYLLMVLHLFTLVLFFLKGEFLMLWL
uniref:NADH dehydrogenase subunit 4 n=1 Tax=Ophrygonius sp. TaxID=2897803 RepID=UPI001EDCF839|nr:NADH dehydrogenase subunit 4 [Ophrygonius sp.]UFK32144.1 NADH dehydrogenase subunit 4 [Ophrygonius sp.]UIN24739.1 NADH dehydrogenase subunit 4 [Ophrygonius sp.]